MLAGFFEMNVMIEPRGLHYLNSFPSIMLRVYYQIFQQGTFYYS